ncbi:MAG: hypothetical protein MJ101_00860 [Clostridia bacterium]|nr:hypothetical protein [Clostridia bacterium]
MKNTQEFNPTEKEQFAELEDKDLENVVGGSFEYGDTIYSAGNNNIDSKDIQDKYIVFMGKCYKAHARHGETKIGDIVLAGPGWEFREVNGGNAKMFVPDADTTTFTLYSTLTECQNAANK